MTNGWIPDPIRVIRSGVAGLSTIVFVCVHNAGRSQMAEAFFNAFCHPECAHAISAGSDPAHAIHPNVLIAMREKEYDLAARQPQRLTEEMLRGVQSVVTMGCGDDPAVQGVRREDWQIADPAEAPLEEVRRIRDEIERKVWKLVVKQGWVRLQPRALKVRPLRAPPLLR
jgi:arsenate reductase